MQQEIDMSPKMDVVFKAFFTKKGNENLLEDFLSSILGEKIKCKEIINEARVGAKRPEEKYGSLDIKAVLENGVEIDIEMQMADKNDTVNRALYYMSMLTAEGLHPSETYNQMKQKVVIFLMDYELFKLDKTIVSSYICLNEDKEQEITNLQKYYFIDLTKAQELTDKDRRRLRLWLAFLNRDKKELSKMKEDKIMKKAEEEYGYLTGDEELKRLAWLRLKAKRDEMASRLLGIEEGVKEGKIEVAKKMIKKGINLVDIIEITGLSAQELEKIKQ